MAQNLVEYILDIKTKAAEQGIKAISKSVDVAGKRLDKLDMKAFTKSIDIAKKGLAGLKTTALAVTGASVALAGAVGVAVKEVADLVNELNDLSVRSGLATDTISGLRFALVASGQDAEGLNEILGAVSGQFAQLSTEGSAVEKKFMDFGISVRNTNGDLRSNNEILLDVIDNITGLQDPSERSRRAVALIGEAGSKLNQALAAGDFQSFVEITKEFGVRAAPEASKQAAILQKNISALGTFTAGFTQRLTTAVNGSQSLNTALEFLISTIGGLTKLVESQVVTLSSLTNAFFEALDSVMEFAAFFVTGFSQIEHSLFSSIKGLINFKDTAREGFASSKDGLLGFVENTFLVGQAILKNLIIPIQAFVTAARATAEFLNLEMAGSLKGLEKSLQSMHRSLDIATDEGFVAFASFSNGAKKSLTGLRKTTTAATKDLDGLGKSLNNVAEETKETTEEIRTLQNVIDDTLNKFVSFDINKFISDFSIAFDHISKKLNETFNVDKINGWIKNLENAVGSTLTEFSKQEALKLGFGGEVEVVDEKRLDKIIRKFKIGIGKAIVKSVKLLGKAGGKVGAALSKGLSAGAAAAVSGILAVIKVAENLGQRGDSVEEIEKSVEEDIQARAKAIELGLQALPRILLKTLPIAFVKLVDRIVFGFFKAIAEFVNIIVNGFRSIFTREGLKNIGKNIKEGFKAGLQEFFDRINILGGILSKRGGGRYIPSARGGIKFTGADEGLAMLHRGEFVVPETGQMPQAVQRTMGMRQSGVTVNINAAVVESNAIDELVRQIERRFSLFGSSTSPLFGGR